MAVVCPTNYIDQFSKPSKMKPCTRRRKDYQIPLHVDCSVEYELPNSAKPPMGNKNEPLLMIHPSYYRREESKRRSQFVNNLPISKRRASCRSTRNTVYRGVENTINYGTNNNCMLTRQRMNCNDRKNVADNTQPSTKIPVSAIFPTPPGFDNACLQARTASHCSKNMQSSVPLTSACTAPKVHQVDLISLLRRTIETNSLPQSSIDFNEVPGMSQMHISEHAPVPGPVLDSASTHRTDFLGLNFPTVLGNNEKYDNNDASKYYNRARDRSKKVFCDNNDSVSAHSLKAKAVKRNTIYCENTVGGSVVNSTSVTSNTGAVTFQQQQPAVGVAAIAATPLNCSNCSVIPTVDGNRHPLIRQQPWSATTAPEFPPSSLPMSHVVPKRPLIGIIYPDVPPQLPSSRKRTSDNISWRYDEYGPDDSTLAKRNRISVNESPQISNHRSWANNESEHCKMYYPQESHEMYNNYSNSCAVAGNAIGATCNAWNNRSGENLNTLHLFRL